MGKIKECKCGHATTTHAKKQKKNPNGTYKTQRKGKCLLKSCKCKKFDLKLDFPKMYEALYSEQITQLGYIGDIA